MSFESYLKKNSHKSKTLIIVLVVYFLLGIFLLKYYQYQINADGIIYISIAKGYINSNWNIAISSYWGPLLSWILIPFLFFGQNPEQNLLFTKILSLIIGSLAIISINSLSYKFEINELIRTGILFALVPIILYFAYTIITPDLLLVCILVFYFNIIFSLQYPNKLSNGLLCGLLGALAYLSKSYAFPFFIIHFTLFNFFHYCRNPKLRKNILKNLILGFAIFLVISGLWIGLISTKMEKLTYGTSGEYNQALIGPDSNAFPKNYQNLYKPNDLEPVYYLNKYMEPWTPLESLNSINYELRIVSLNTLDLIHILISFSFISLIILIIYLLFIINTLKRTISTKKIGILKGIILDKKIDPLITILIFSLGYVSIVIMDRYFWIVYILLILMGGYILTILFKNKFFDNKLRKNILLLIFVSSFVLNPFVSLIVNINTGEDIYMISSTIKNQYPIEGNVASNEDRTRSVYLSYYLNTTYYGKTAEKINKNEFVDELKENKINYYYYWGKDINNTKFLPGSKRIISMQNLRIYSMS